MARQTVTESDLLDRALDLFRCYGFEGVSLSRLSAATGLEKASLYYRYPGGKEELANAAVGRVIEWFQANVFDMLKTDLPPRERVLVVVEKLREFYVDGAKPCVIDVLSLPGGGNELAASLKLATEAWLVSFAGLSMAAGLSEEEARLRAEDAVALIEGSLVIARATGEAGAFRRTLHRLPAFLTERDQL